MDDQERWQRISDLYELAYARKPEERRAFLRDACDGDDDIVREVEGLLQQDVSGVGLLEHIADHIESLNSLPLPAKIGRYRILSLVGEGGMGVVYEAEQEHPRRTVALKVIKPGLADGESLRRFEQ